MDTSLQYELDSDIMQFLLTFPASDQICQWVSEGGHVCGATLPPDPKLVSAHFRTAHGLRGDSKERVMCAWQNCDSYPLQWRNMLRHILSVHLELLRWTCPDCLKTLSRRGTGHQCNQTAGGSGSEMSPPA